MDYLRKLFNVEGKVAVITGGSGILGSEMAKGLLSAGAKVVLIGRDTEKLKHKVEEFQAISRDVIGLKCNVLDEHMLHEVNDQILDKFKSIDILINAAGGHLPGAVIGIGQNIFDLKMEDLKKVTDLNLNGTILPTIIFSRNMSESREGSIINISSMASYRAITRVVGYSAAKAAIDNFTRWMAVEMALKFGNGIRVNAIAPGFLITEQNRTLLTNPDNTLTDRGKTILDITPFKRFGNPDELIGATLWLASNASRFVTGAIIPIDGGFSAFSGV